MWDRKKARNRKRKSRQSERAKYLRSRRALKGRYRKSLGTLGYRLFGLVPHTGSGKRRGEYETLMNFLSLQYPKGRWDLDWRDWKDIWSKVPPELRDEFRLVRADTEGPYSPENMVIQSRP